MINYGVGLTVLNTWAQIGVKEDSPESDQTCLNCKPLAPTDHVRQAHQPEDAPQAGRVFYGNEVFYQFYRLHQHMYERYES